MAFDFPNAPTVGQTYTSGGVTYKWDGQAWSGGPVTDSSGFVQRSGDVMTGSLEIDQTSGNAQLILDKPSSGQASAIIGQTNNLNRWYLGLGNTTPEGGSNSGSDFFVHRYDDAGVVIDAPLQIDRASGKVTANLVMPSAFANRSGSGVTNLATNAWTKINLGNISSVNIGGWTLNTQQLVVPKAGTYLVGMSAIIVSPALVTAMLAGFGVNSITAATCFGRQYSSTANSINFVISCQRVITLAAGDLISLLAFCSAAGGTVTDTADGTFLWATMVAAS